MVMTSPPFFPLRHHRRGLNETSCGHDAVTMLTRSAVGTTGFCLVPDGQIAQIPHCRSGRVEFVNRGASVGARHLAVTPLFIPALARFAGAAPLSLHREAR